jgi:chemotaxis protein methyltransferase CheR
VSGLDAVMTDDQIFDLEVRLFMEGVFERYCQDFRQYALVSVRRRLAQALVHFRCDPLSMLQHRVLREPVLFTELLGFLTVHVSELFRDPEYFRALRSQVLPHLATYPSIRVWIAGCSTGEEAYSVAILLREEGLLERALLYATDVDPQALAVGRGGIYPVERMAAFSASYQKAGGRGSLSDHYTAAYDGAAFDRGLRNRIVFSDHSLATDGVFAEVHLVSCRNVLIYFDRPLQDRALELFHKALVRAGFLGLGAKESLLYSTHAGQFSEFVAEQRIYQKR